MPKTNRNIRKDRADNVIERSWFSFQNFIGRTQCPDGGDCEK